MAEFKTNLHQV